MAIFVKSPKKVNQSRFKHKIEKRVYDVTVTLLFVVEQNEGHIRTQRPKIYKNQCENLQK